VTGLALSLLLLAAPADPEASKQAFLDVYKVLTHPRCLNCHPGADQPLQGDRSLPHAQRVKRAADGRGQFAVKCMACHQSENTPGAHMPPGAPGWHLPASQQKLVFEGRKPGELCRQIKDPKQNGGKTLAQIHDHMANDALVAWGWKPGDGRAPVPGTQQDLGRRVQAWIDGGATCPE
jgi:hypothetical protein